MEKRCMLQNVVAGTRIKIEYLFMVEKGQNIVLMKFFLSIKFRLILFFANSYVIQTWLTYYCK